MPICHSKAGWYLDDGVVAGPSLAVQKVLALIEEKGPPLGLLVNPSKCEVSLFLGELKRSCSPNMGVPIGGLEYCTSFISNKCGSTKTLLCKLEEGVPKTPKLPWFF